MAATKRAIAYVRVSTNEQLDGYGLEVQEESVRGYCRAHALRLVGVTRDEGESGANGLEDRDGLAAALARLEAGDAEVLVVPRLDRLARDLLLQETVIRRLEQADRAVVSVSEPDIANGDPTRVLVRHVLGAIAQYEAAVIRGRLSDGKARKIADGGYGGGRPPYGKRAHAGKLVDNPDEARLVEQVSELRAEGRSYQEVCDVLEAEGFRPRKAQHWQPMVVRSIATRAGLD
jgi:DNA invertase Pin-like site-specific DNA recombinase